MEITDVFLLPTDVLVVPVNSLPEEQRCKFSADDGDFAITRLRGRSRSKIIDTHIAKLLQEFKGGKTIVDAIISFSQGSGLDPKQTLEVAYPILEMLINASFLVAEGSDKSEPVDASVGEGDDWAGLEIVRLVQILQDTEIYQARTTDGRLAALKIVRPEAIESLTPVIDREARILEHLVGSVAPRLVAHSKHNGRPYLASQWCEGVDSLRGATRLRSIYSKQGRQRLLAFCCDILDAYTLLHAQNVIHGDVHERNLIVGDNASVTIIDFGLSRLATSKDRNLSRARRGGAGYYFEPEYASRFLQKVDKKRPPLSSFLGEQHILAHLLYRLLTGHYFARFSAEREESMRQLAESKPEPFSRWGIAPWPDVERVLARALAPEPGDRYESVQEFANALRKADVPEPIHQQAKPAQPLNTPLSDRLLKDYIRRLDPAERLFESGLQDAPFSSVNYGSGGVACFLYRLASVQADAQLLSWAKLWIEKAIKEAETKGEEAFTNPEMGISRDIIGDISLYHSITGLYAVKALIGHAMGDIPSQLDGIRSFTKAAEAPCDNIDVTLGSSGILLGCALLNETMPGHAEIDQTGIKYFNDIHGRIQTMPPIAEEKHFLSTGIAHGWAGVLYAFLMWCRSSKSMLPEDLPERLTQLADLAEPAQVGIQWQVKLRSSEHRHSAHYLPSWCNGTGGMIHLWTLAHAMMKDDRYLEMAEGAAWNAIAARPHINQLCCGRPGQAYGVLNLYKHTMEKRWLDYARQLADESLRLSPPPSVTASPRLHCSLYKGPIGSALLFADMATPECAAMPLFESEGWQS